MGRSSLPALDLDDPLRSPRAQATADGPAEQPGSPIPASEASADDPPVKAQRARRRPARQAPVDTRTEHPAAEATESAGVWREWGRGSRTATYRLPEDLLEELDSRSRTLELPLGMTVGAALLQLLDQDDSALIAAVERVEDARLQASRRARRLTSA